MSAGDYPKREYLINGEDFDSIELAVKALHSIAPLTARDAMEALSRTKLDKDPACNWYRKPVEIDKGQS